MDDKRFARRFWRTVGRNGINDDDDEIFWSSMLGGGQLKTTMFTEIRNN